MDFFSDLFSGLWDGLVSIFDTLIKPITDFIVDTGYFFEKFFDVVVWIVKIILAILKLSGSVGLGLLNTVGNFVTYQGTGSYSWGKFGTGFSKAAELAGTVGFNTLPTVISFVVVMISMVIVVKVLRYE